MAQLPGGSASDFWWLKPQQPDNPLPAIQLGMQNAHQQRLDKIALAEAAYKAQVREQVSLGGAEFAGVVADIYRSGDIASPESQAKLYDVGKKYPYLLGTEPWKGLQNQIEDAEKLKLRKELIDQAGYVPPDPETGMPGYFMDARGGIRFGPRPVGEAPKWIQADPETGMPAHFETSTGNVRFPPRMMPDGSTFQPEEITTPGGTRMIRVSPNKFQVLDKPLLTGRMTDAEKQDILDIRKDRAVLMKSIEDMGGPPKPGLFGGESKKLKEYNSKIAALDTLTAKRDEIYRKAEARQTQAAPVGDPDERVEVTKDGQTMTLPRSQLEEGRKQGWLPK